MFGGHPEFGSLEVAPCTEQVLLKVTSPHSPGTAARCSVRPLPFQCNCACVSDLLLLKSINRNVTAPTSVCSGIY